MPSISDLSFTTKAIWAKKRTIDGDPRWLPLVTHLQDTTGMISKLYTYWLSERQRRILSGNLPEEEAEKLVRFVGSTHDIGKATPAFETKPSYDGNSSADEELLERLIRAGFEHLDTLCLSSAKFSPHAKAGEAILENFGVPESVGAVIGGHHGRPLDTAPDDELRDHTANYWQADRDVTIQAPWQKVQRELLDHALHDAGYASVDEIPDIDQPQAIILEGLLIMADWLASSEYLNDDPEKPMFPLVSMATEFDQIDEDSRIAQAWGRWYISEAWEPRRIGPHENIYHELWGFDPRPVQETITNRIAEATDPGIVIVEAPMGIGKTEIALVAAEQLAYKNGEDGLFFGLPTQATTNAMFDRVSDWLDKQAQASDADLEVGLLHGKASFNQTFMDLPKATAVDVDQDGESASVEPTVVVNSWFSGKKSILNEFAVGTIDNLLLMALKQKHLALRHLGLSKKVVILDEVHAYDAYMDSYLAMALKWLGAYHVPVIILSATLPKQKRNDILAAYFAGKYGQQLSKPGLFTSVFGT